MFFPRWAFEIWAGAAGDIICANDKDVPISKAQRMFWLIRGNVLHFLFGWWVYIRPTSRAAMLLSRLENCRGWHNTQTTKANHRRHAEKDDTLKTTYCAIVGEEREKILEEMAKREAAEQSAQLTAFRRRLAWLAFGFILLLAMVLVIVGSN